MISQGLQNQIQDAMRAGDAIRVSTLRLLSNALHNEQIAKQRDLTQDEEVQILKRQLKQRDEAVEALRQALGKPTSSSEAEIADRIEKEKQEAEILKEFLPEQMGEEEIGILVDRVIRESGTREFGAIMGTVMKEVQGKADGKTVSRIVAEKLK